MIHGKLSGYRRRGSSRALNFIKDGHTVAGVDNLNETYDPRKEYRLKKLQALPGFTFHKQDISQKSVIDHFKDHQFEGVINLAAWPVCAPVAGDPWAYVKPT